MIPRRGVANMAANSSNDITRLLLEWSDGNGAALSELFPLVYEELRRMAEQHLRRERSAHTLQRTALVHEAFLRLADQKHVTWRSRAQFFGLASQMMRRILVDYARKRNAAKRGQEPVRIDLDGAGEDLPPQLLSVESHLDFDRFDDVLQRLEQLDPRQGKLVELRFFGGLSLEEAAEVLGVSLATVKRDWVFARAWLQRELADCAN
ncbi:MAG TPA: sigma-70 family RNA polymerase sigma factor [Steroidobacteraceae bacterium]|nr:sigma-70 family RNA polymerase sigma factor [Steroidobacteraceae bacterium]